MKTQRAKVSRHKILSTLLIGIAWLCKLKVENVKELDELLSDKDYEEFCQTNEGH